MHTFTLIWLGQLVSTIGSYMTSFALTLWAWQLTGSATALALVGFFYELPQIPVALFAGIIVDRFNRKYLMILGDAISALSTLILLLLHLTGQLHLWHLYLTSAAIGGFGQIQQLAYSTSITTLVPVQHYTRANSMNSVVHYGSIIIAPAAAGLLYPVIGLAGVLMIDLATFGVAIATLLLSHIPQPPPEKTGSAKQTGKLSRLWQETTFGIRYIWQHPHLLRLLIITALFWFFHDLGSAIDDPMILARSGSNAQVLGAIGTAAGIGGVTGAIVLTAWGGPKQRIHGLLIGFMGAGLAKTFFGLGQNLKVWVPAQFFSSLNFPLLGSSETAIWMESTTPEIQGRVFAANSLVLQGVSTIATLIAGPLAERIFEPAVHSKKVAWVVEPILGTQLGAGTALLYILTSLALVLVGVGGYCLPPLSQANDPALIDSQESHADE
ncbi:hypothetical protein C1752_03446 [Acaryochloris thomasi RCC1774]|uniref:MFS transporter n=1 Tax=Acaryochloris thomasi RCC1774 TaxID=1764569 RepID=A0A2W1JG71_9CYAN|nr:MFS transporter [Acaryochloris thomasi]PZD72610.1 hypothetical protein C1752_03446 [Acaryochloris thomasi RCC1774]